jgi:hypothetical protein
MRNRDGDVTVVVDIPSRHIVVRIRRGHHTVDPAQPNTHRDARTADVSTPAYVSTADVSTCATPAATAARSCTYPCARCTSQLLPAQQFGHLLQSRRILPQLRSRGNRSNC